MWKLNDLCLFAIDHWNVLITVFQEPNEHLNNILALNEPVKFACDAQGPNKLV